MAITRRQRQVYDYISDFVQRNGYSPSFEEIGEGMGLSSLATVHKHISNLEKKGLLTRDYNRSRSIDLLPPKGRLKQAMAVNTTLPSPAGGWIRLGLPHPATVLPSESYATTAGEGIDEALASCPTIAPPWFPCRTPLNVTPTSHPRLKV